MPKEPTYVKLAPKDDGTGLDPIFLQHPDSFHPYKGEDGRIEFWGIIDRKGDPMASMMRMMTAQSHYKPFGDMEKPEVQYANRLIEKKQKKLRGMDLGDLTKSDFVVKIHMPNIPLENGDARIWRRIRFSSGMKLSVFSDKIILPVMEWMRNFHAHMFMDHDDGAIFGEPDMTSVDAVHIGMHGYALLPEKEFAVAHLLQKVGDIVGYMYDFGDHFMHEITLEEIIPASESTGAVSVLGGSGSCPAENGNGNESWAQKIPALLNPYEDLKASSEAREIVRGAPNYEFDARIRRASAKGFDPDYFAVLECQQIVSAALNSPDSIPSGARTFNMPMHPDALDPKSLFNKPGKKKHVIFRSTDASGGWGFYQETVNTGRDSSSQAICAKCGAPPTGSEKLRLCAGCGKRWYCGRACQTSHWKATHKYECKDLKEGKATQLNKN